MNDFKLLIDGMLVKGAGTLDVINPATGRILTAAPRADRSQLEEAVAAAKTAFPDWSAKPLRERGALLVELAEALEAEQSTFAHLLTEEQGKPLSDALFEIAFSVSAFRYFATLDLPVEVLHEDAVRKVVQLRIRFQQLRSSFSQPKFSRSKFDPKSEHVRLVQYRARKQAADL